MSCQCLGIGYIILKEIILKTTESSSMKLNILGVEHHKFILGLISLVFYICTACDTTHVKSIGKLLPNTLLNVSGNNIQGESDSLFELINVSRNCGRTSISHLKYLYKRKPHGDKSGDRSDFFSSETVFIATTRDSHWDKHVLFSSIQ